MFLERLSELIESHKITRNKLLLDIGINTNAFNNWKRQGTVPGGITLAKIADYFHVSTDYLLCRTDDPRPVGEEKELAPAAEGGPIYPPEYDQLSPEDRALVDSMIRRLILEKNQEDTSSPSSGAGGETA